MINFPFSVQKTYIFCLDEADVMMIEETDSDEDASGFPALNPFGFDCSEEAPS